VIAGFASGPTLVHDVHAWGSLEFFFEFLSFPFNFRQIPSFFGVCAIASGSGTSAVAEASLPIRIFCTASIRLVDHFSAHLTSFRVIQ